MVESDLERFTGIGEFEPFGEDRSPGTSWELDLLILYRRRDVL